MVLASDHYFKISITIHIHLLSGMCFEFGEILKMLFCLGIHVITYTTDQKETARCCRVP